MSDIIITSITKPKHGFWVGFGAGLLFMAVLDLTDIHVCVGECDGAGYDLFQSKKIERK